jgi:hypothetical protein
LESESSPEKFYTGIALTSITLTAGEADFIVSCGFYVHKRCNKINMIDLPKTQGYQTKPCNPLVVAQLL